MDERSIETTYGRPHASELAQLRRSAVSSPQPGSIEEARALARIDEARADELAELGDTRARKRRRLRRHWSDRGAQLDGR